MVRPSAGRGGSGSREVDSAEVTAFRLSTGTRVEVMRARYTRQSFAKHSHEYFTVGLMLSGTGSLWWRGGVQVLRPGEVVIIPPGEVHTGGLGEADQVLSYMAAHIPDDAVALYAAAESAGATALRNGGPAIICDPRLSAELGRLAHLTEGRQTFDAREAEDAVTGAIGCVADWLSARPANPETLRSLAPQPPFVSRARQIMDDCYADHARTSLAALAREAGVTPFHLVREFTRSTGLSPHRYLVQRRVGEARELLARGVAPSLAAAMTGFVDQSHLTTQFRRYVGTTPASYRRGLLRRP